jgi:hypothetical protein
MNPSLRSLLSTEELFEYDEYANSSRGSKESVESG